MLWSMVVAAAKPWTYWLAPMFLVAALVLIVVVAIGYYRKVAVPGFWLRVSQEQAQRQRTQVAQRSGEATVHRLPTGAKVQERQAA